MFNDDNFLLHTKTAAYLYRTYAENLPIVDYHCHLEVKDIFEDRHFKNIAELWLGKGGSFQGDHYKWRLMRACGIDEKYITGSENDEARFIKWAECLERSIGNPLYHWCHMELKAYFGIEDILTKKSASNIFTQCSRILSGDDMSARSFILKSKVRVLCTTDDPADNLIWHEKLAEDNSFPVRVLPAFRPDLVKDPTKPDYIDYLKRLGNAAGMEISSFADLKEVIVR